MSDFTNEDLYITIIAALIKPTMAPNTTVIRTNDNAPKGADPYVALNIGPFNKIGWDERGAPDDITGDVLVTGVRETILTIEVYGTNALQLCANLRNAMSLNSVLDVLRAAGVALGTMTPVLNLTKLYETQWKERGQFQAHMRFRSETIDKAVSSIIEVEGTVIVKSTGNSDVPINLNIGDP